MTILSLLICGGIITLTSLRQQIVRIKSISYRTSLTVKWLRLCTSSASTAGGVSSIPGQGTKVPHARRRAGGGGGISYKVSLPGFES